MLLHLAGSLLKKTLADGILLQHSMPCATGDLSRAQWYLLLVEILLRLSPVMAYFCLNKASQIDLISSTDLYQ